VHRCGHARAPHRGRAVRVLIGTEPKNLVARDISEAKVTWEGFSGDNHAGLTRPADVRVKWFPRDVPIPTPACRGCPPRSSRSLPVRLELRQVQPRGSAPTWSVLPALPRFLVQLL
jgi:hypothetical protein